MVDDSGAMPFCSSHSYSLRVNFSEIPPKRNSSPLAVFTVISFSEERLLDSAALIFSSLKEGYVNYLGQLHSVTC